eukprot:692153-Rhodomonas_salina.1
MVDEKKNPKKAPVGKGWRAGSPMANAAKPPTPVHIGLNRQQQQVFCSPFASLRVQRVLRSQRVCSSSFFSGGD